MRVLGIDPGSKVTGYGVVDQLEGRLAHVAHGNLRPPRNAPETARLQHLYRAIVEVVERYRPDAAVVEQVFVSSSPRSALVLGQARGAALAALGACGLGASEYAASQIKQAVSGSGRSSKLQVQTMVGRLLGLARVPASDAADALAAAICHLHAGRLLEIGLRRRRRRPPAPRRGIAISPRPPR